MEAIGNAMVDWAPPRGESRRPAAPREADEARLVGALQRGEAEAIALLELRCGRVLTGFLREALPDAAAAEEVRQQVLLEVWRRGPEYDPARAGVLTWVMTIARSRAIDERRKRRPAPIDPTALEEPTTPGEESSPEVERMIERWSLAELLDRIPAEEAAALRLRFYDELVQTEIAERLGVPLGTVKTRMVRGLSRLRELLLEEGGR